MKARTNVILMSAVTIGLFAYAFLQPIFLPTHLSNELHINPYALVFGLIAIWMDIKQFTRIRNHYRHLQNHITDPKCQDCLPDVSQKESTK